jgi:hypothetical protein
LQPTQNVQPPFYYNSGYAGTTVAPTYGAPMYYYYPARGYGHRKGLFNRRGFRGHRYAYTVRGY